MNKRVLLALWILFGAVFLVGCAWTAPHWPEWFKMVAYICAFQNIVAGIRAWPQTHGTLWFRVQVQKIEREATGR